MTSCITGSRPRRAAWLALLCGITTVGQVGSAFAQQSSPEGMTGGTVVSDDAASPGSYGPCFDSCHNGACDGSCPCDESMACQSCDRQLSLAGWFGAELIHWQLNANKLPPLVTAGPSTTPLANVARLDDPDTVILTDRRVNDDWRNGYRFTGGIWLDCCRCWAIGGDYFDAGQDDYNFVSPQNPNIIVGRPFFNTQLGSDDAELVSVPNELDGTAHVHADDDFRGAGITFSNRIWQWCDPCDCQHGAQLLFLTGYRHYDYDSDLSINENLTVLPGTTTLLVVGTNILVNDRFRTENNFNGGEIGFQGVGKHCWWWLDGMAKLAIGENDRSVTINGQTTVTVPNFSPVTNPGGQLTSDVTNIGHYHDSEFALIPEFRLGGGVRVCNCCSVRAGYNLILWSDVTRSGSELPPGLAVDPRNLPPVQAGGGADPAFPGIRGSQLAVQGIDISVLFQF